jgi:large subunit ribosomal protein L11
MNLSPPLISPHFRRPGHVVAGKIHVKQIYEIAKIKQRDESLADIDLENLCRCIAGSCSSMGIEVVNEIVSEE